LIVDSDQTLVTGFCIAILHIRLKEYFAKNNRSETHNTSAS